MTTAKEHPLADVARQWLREMQECTNTQDYARARRLCAPDVVLFSIRTNVEVGVDAVEREQWRQAWPSVREFAFRLGEVYCFGGEQGLTAAVQGDMQLARPDGTTVPMSNRATVTLVQRDGRWVAAHLHFSLPPAPRQAVTGSGPEQAR